MINEPTTRGTGSGAKPAVGRTHLMKKSVRLVLRIAVVGIALIGTALLVSLDTVDYRPFFREPYCKDTIARLQVKAETNLVAFGELNAGFGRALLTPTVNVTPEDPASGRFATLSLAGYGARKGRPATGVHDDLYVKAVALRVAGQVGVMVAVDALIIPPEIAESACWQLEQQPGLRREQIYLSATHTHASLGGWGEGMVAESFAGKFHAGARTWFADRIVAAVREAVADLKPASFGQGAFAAPEFVRNRVVGELGKIDPEFSFITLKQTTGRIAVLGSYAAHATVLSSDLMQFSADYPGYWQRAVEEATGGVALFLAGGVGSHAPVPGEHGFAGAERMGTALARMLLDQSAQTVLTNAISFGILGLDVSMPPLNVRISDGLRLRPWIAARLVPARKQSFLQGFRLDRSIWISTPCDFSGELALGIKQQLQPTGRAAVITSFNGDYVGYVIPCRYYHLNGYEPRIMSFFGPNVPDYFDQLIRTIALDLAD